MSIGRMNIGEKILSTPCTHHIVVSPMLWHAPGNLPPEREGHLWKSLAVSLIIVYRCHWHITEMESFLPPQTVHKMIAFEI